MSENTTGSIRENYDRLADAYARRFVNELQSKPLDRELLHRFATEIRGHGYVSDTGYGLGHVARYLRGARATIQPDESPQMAEQAQQLNLDMAQAVLHRVQEADSF